MGRTVRETPSARDRILSLRRFLDYLVVRGRIPGHVLGELLEGCRSGVAVVRALRASPGAASAAEVRRALEPARYFRSGMAGWLEALLRQRRRRRQRWKPFRDALARLDRVLVRSGVEAPEQITPRVVDDYLRWNGPGPSTRNARLDLLRKLHRFVARRGGRMLDPDQGWTRLAEACFRPHLFTLKEVGGILAALRQRAEASEHPFGGYGVELLVYLLYACGLRAREPLGLRLGDVDFGQRALFVARTKFYKQRWVPLADGAVRRLLEYARLRQEAFPGRDHPGEPFFLNARGRRFSYAGLHGPFRQAVERLGIRSRGTRPPRLHDLRHAMAVHRLYRWYAEGADVQNKLPLLSVYLGHSRVHHTEAYLHLAEDLLRMAGRSFQAAFEQVVGGRVPDDAPPA